MRIFVPPPNPLIPPIMLSQPNRPQRLSLLGLGPMPCRPKLKGSQAHSFICLNRCLPNVRRHIFPMFEVIITQLG